MPNPGEETVRVNQNLNINQNIQEDTWEVVNHEIKSRSAILDELNLDRNKKSDSSRMAAIKKASAHVDNLLGISMPLESSLLEKEIPVRMEAYQVLVEYCNDYIDKNGKKEKGIAFARCSIVKRLREVALKEMKSFRSAVATVLQQNPYVKGQKESLEDWSRVLVLARSEEYGRADSETDTLQTEANKEVLDNSIFLTRMSSALGVGDLYTQTNRYKDKDGNIFVRQSNGVSQLTKAGMISLDNLDGITDRQTRFAFSKEALRKHSALKMMEALTGVRTKTEDIFVEYESVKEKQTLPDGTEKEVEIRLLIKNIIVHNTSKGFFAKAPTEDDKKKKVIADKLLIAKLEAMDDSVMNFLMKDIIPSKRQKNFGKRLNTLKKRIKVTGSRSMTEKDWNNHGSEYARYISENESNKSPFSKRVSASKSGVEGRKIEKVESKNKSVQKPFEYANEAKEIKRLMAAFNRVSVKRPETEIGSSKEVALIKYKMDEFDRNSLDAGLCAYKVKNNGATCDMRMELSKEKLFPSLPTTLDIQQGHVGDCYLLASLSAIVRRRPSYIINMFKDYGDFVSVTFPGYDPVYVSKRVLQFKQTTEGDDKYRDYCAKGPLWVKLFEKAYAKIREKTQGIDSAKVDPKSTENKAKFIMAFAKEKRFSKRAIMENEPNYLGEYANFRELYYKTIESIAGGSASDAVSHILGVKYVNKDLKIITADSMKDPYKSLWKKVTGLNEKQRYVANLVKDMLAEEIKKRQLRKYTNKSDEVTKGTEANLTIEDIVDTLKDIKKWSRFPEAKSYSDFFAGLKSRFETPTEKFTEGSLETILKELAQKLMESHGLQEEQTFEHRVGATDSNGRRIYSQRAVQFANAINTISANDVITASTNRYINAKDGGSGLNGERLSGGVYEGHAYLVIGIDKSQYEDPNGDGSIMIKLRNPWGTGGAEYEKVTEENGDSFLRTVRRKEDGDGVFEMDLNDFMRYFSRFSLSEDNMANNRRILRRL